MVVSAGSPGAKATHLFLSSDERKKKRAGRGRGREYWLGAEITGIFSLTDWGGDTKRAG